MPAPAFFLFGLFSAILKLSSLAPYGNILIVLSKSCIVVTYYY